MSVATMDNSWPSLSGDLCEVLMLLPSHEEREFAFALVRKILHDGGKSTVPVKYLSKIAEGVGLPYSVHSIQKHMKGMSDLFEVEAHDWKTKAPRTYSLRPTFAECARNSPLYSSWHAFLKETGREVTAKTDSYYGDRKPVKKDKREESKVVNIKQPARKPDNGTYMFLKPGDTIALAVPIKGYDEALTKAREFLRNNHDVTSVTLVQVRAEITLGERPVLVKEYV